MAEAPEAGSGSKKPTFESGHFDPFLIQAFYKTRKYAAGPRPCSNTVEASFVDGDKHRIAGDGFGASIKESEVQGLGFKCFRKSGLGQIQ